MPNQKTQWDSFEREGPVIDHPALLFDRGCDVAPSYLAGPLTVCRYDAQPTEADREKAA